MLSFNHLKRFVVAASVAAMVAVAGSLAAPASADSIRADTVSAPPPVATLASNVDYLAGAQLAQAEDEVNDPLESFNRGVFAFNEGFYDLVLRPLARAYNTLPVEIRTIIGSILSNLRAPVVFVNDVLQGEPERAFDTARRFAINSTIGFGGMADVASSMGIPKHTEDFGQTLAVWGVDEGFYLVLPILGPSSPRDAIGRYVVDSYIDPWGYYLENTDQEEWGYVRMGATAVTEFAGVMEELDDIKRTSIDYYAAVRSLYRQKRRSEIANGGDVDLPPIPDLEFGGAPSEPYDVEQPAMGGSMAPDDEPASYEETRFDPSDADIVDPFAPRFAPVQLATTPVADGLGLPPQKPSLSRSGLAADGAWTADAQRASTP